MQFKKIKASMDCISRKFKKISEPTSPEDLFKMLQTPEAKIYSQVIIALRVNGQEILVHEMGMIIKEEPLTENLFISLYIFLQKDNIEVHRLVDLNRKILIIDSFDGYDSLLTSDEDFGKALEEGMDWAPAPPLQMTSGILNHSGDHSYGCPSMNFAYVC